MSVVLALALLAAAAPEGEGVQVAVLAHPVARGDRIEAGDFTFEAREPAQARGALDPNQAGGMEASRALMAGSVVRRTDVVTPRLVHRGDPVTIRVVRGTMVITAAGRALNDAAAGAPVRVVTDTTSRTLDGVAEAAGTVRVRIP
ncbi:flagellar basal body P-ring formation chaperone FlgA [Sphingomonas sp.]|uniref:flagellar basal body P-ring formation chaperone FlgA n=1 Tax=Sphingomonas sp. TaxID=28214 RepID=UPI001B05872C|nr:flagellar basal body P-ring formation chaperone FlgA [Sphingomonas sp.]MBO9713506.1 flagellar basal body P-ring formation protein FlgA [Sphingomonas sp.]